METLETLMRNYGNDVLRLAYFYVKEYHVAEDIFQDVFLRVNQHLDSFRGESNIKTWILKITINASKDYLKSAYHTKVKIITEEEERIPTTEDDYEKIEKKNDLRYVREILKQMPEKYREILWLLYFEEKTIKEIAYLLGLQEGTVKSRAFRAKERFKKELRNYGKEEMI